MRKILREMGIHAECRDGNNTRVDEVEAKSLAIDLIFLPFRRLPR